MLVSASVASSVMCLQAAIKAEPAKRAPAGTSRKQSAAAASNQTNTPGSAQAGDQKADTKSKKGGGKAAAKGKGMGDLRSMFGKK
jgi:hypothetical protein